MAILKCKGCGRELSAEQNFCTNCGAKVDTPEPSGSSSAKVLRFAAVMIPLGLWIASMFLPAIGEISIGICGELFGCPSVETLQGFQAALWSVFPLSWIAIFPFFGALTNILLPTGSLFVFKGECRAAAISGSIALAGAIIAVADLGSLGTGNQATLLVGYWVWLASSVVLPVSAMVSWRLARAKT